MLLAQPSVGSASPSGSPRKFRTGAIRTVLFTHCFPTSCAPASSPSPAAMRMPTISTGCAATRLLSWPAGSCPTPGPTCARSRPSRAGRTRPHLRDLIRLMDVMVDLYCNSYATPPAAVTLDIDDTVDVVHGHQQLSFFNAHYDERCFLPIHVYDTAVARPVAVLLRPGKTPSGTEVRGHLRRLVRRIRRHWPQTRITIRGDAHYGRPAVMEWCDENGVDFVFGLSGNGVLDRLVDETADDIRTRRALDQNPVYAASPRPGTGRNPGARSAASVLGSRPPRRASTSASSSPASRRDRPSISTRRSTALVARPRTSLNRTRRSSLPTAPAAVVRSPTRCA